MHDTRCEWENYIKMNIKEKCCECIHCILWAQDRVWQQALVNWICLNCPSAYWLLKGIAL
jgi:hypothetical protein